MARPKWFIKLLQKTFPGRFFLARLTKIPGIKKFVDYVLFDNDEIYVIPKKEVSKTIVVNKTIEQSENILIPTQIVDEFIEKASYHFVMNFCLCRSAEKCENYPIELGCLFLGETAKKIDPDLGREVTKEEAKEHVRKCREAGLVHIIGRNKLDTQWLDAKPGTKLLTICNCCECCCLWKFIPNLSVKISKKMMKIPGVVVKVSDRCVGCCVCTEGVCYVNAIKMYEGKALINEKICRSCSRCIEICPNKAIEIIIEDPDFIEKTINRINELVDVT